MIVVGRKPGGAGGGGSPAGPAGGVLGGTYPNPSFAVDMATQAELNAVAFTNVVKTADESVTADVTPQNDDELFFATVAGKVFDIVIGLVYASPVGGGTPDIKVVLGEDATARGILGGPCISNTDANFFGSAQTNQTQTIVGGTNVADRTMTVIGTHVGGGGTFRVMWAQNTSNGNPTIVRAGSYISYRRIT